MQVESKQFHLTDCKCVFIFMKGEEKFRLREVNREVLPLKYSVTLGSEQWHYEEVMAFFKNITSLWLLRRLSKVLFVLRVASWFKEKIHLSMHCHNESRILQ